MVWGWRRAFCTSISKEQQERDSPVSRERSEEPTYKNSGSRFVGFFSNPSTPRLGSGFALQCSIAKPAVATEEVHSHSISASEYPTLVCETKFATPRSLNRSAPSSPRSPSTFSLLKSSLRLSRLSTGSRCGICLQRVKTDQGTAIFTAECGHSFHFPCISAHVNKKASLTCPICGFTWKQVHLLNQNKSHAAASAATGGLKISALKVYNDDEPLCSPTSGARFSSIPESDETEGEYEEFPGFFAADNVVPAMSTHVQVALLPEAAMVSSGKTSETCAVVLKLKAPVVLRRRIPVDLVAVLNVSKAINAEKIQFMKKAMRMVVASLAADDRLSIVAFSTLSKRLTPLRRMNATGRRSARRIIDAVVSLDGDAATVTDSLKKAAKVIEDRREKNPASIILLFSDGHRNGPLVSSTRFTSSEIPVHYVNLGACSTIPAGDLFAERISGLLSEVVQDLRIRLSLTPDSAPAEISAVYSNTGKPAFLGSGSNPCWIGALHSEEEREVLIELKVPSSLDGSRRLLAVQCCYEDLLTQQTIYDKERHLLIPQPRAVGSSTPSIHRLRCLFVTTRAIAESRILSDRGDLASANRLLASARALVRHSGSDSAEEFVRGLEARMAELNAKIQNCSGGCRADEKAEPLTPTSAWRAAERLAKVAKMRKSLNRVSDLHGLEDARF